MLWRSGSILRHLHSTAFYRAEVPIFIHLRQVVLIMYSDSSSTQMSVELITSGILKYSHMLVSAYASREKSYGNDIGNHGAVAISIYLM